MTSESYLRHSTPLNGAIFHLSCSCFVYQQLSDGHYNECFHSNVTKPNVTRAGDEMDSRGGSAVPTKRPEMGFLVCMGNCLRGQLTGACLCPHRVTAELLMWSMAQSSQGTVVAQSDCD